MIPWFDYLEWRDRFAQALDQRLYTIAHLDWLVNQPHVKLWCNDKAAIIAELKSYPSGAFLVEGVIAAGDLDEIKKLIPKAERWGAECGCIGGSIESREAWAREMRGEGYAPFQTKLIKWFEGA